MLPLFHDFEGERVLIFGGGRVGARRARRFAREARVLVIAGRFDGEDFAGTDRVRAAPTADEVGGWLDRADPALVVAATDEGAVNEAIEAAARDRGTLVNRADEHGGHDRHRVTVPAAVFEEPVVVAIATGGASPALSGYLRERVESELAGAGALARLTADLREDLVDRGVDPATRREAIRSVVRSERVWAAVRDDEDGCDARRVARAVLEAALGEDGE